MRNKETKVGETQTDRQQTRDYRAGDRDRDIQTKTKAERQIQREKETERNRLRETQGDRHIQKQKARL